jgi:hypothetical protein
MIKNMSLKEGSSERASDVVAYREPSDNKDIQNLISKVSELQKHTSGLSAQLQKVEMEKKVL